MMCSMALASFVHQYSILWEDCKGERFAGIKKEALLRGGRRASGVVDGVEWAFPSGEGGRAERGRMRSQPCALHGLLGEASSHGVCANLSFPSWADYAPEAFPSGEGGRAERGRMRSQRCALHGLLGEDASRGGCANLPFPSRADYAPEAFPLWGRWSRGARSDEIAALHPAWPVGRGLFP